MSRINQIGWTLVLVSSLSAVRNVVFWVLCLGIALVSWRFLVASVEMTMPTVAYHAHLRPIAFYAHVGLAPIALALVPFQLWRGLRDERRAIHRLLGRLYGVAVVLSGLGGLWLAMTTTSGPIASSGFALLAVLWVATTIMGIGSAMAGNLANHRAWMTRSIALTLAAVTLRLYLPLSMLTGLPFDAAYTAIAWLCWVPNLIVAELVLNRRRRLVAA